MTLASLSRASRGVLLLAGLAAVGACSEGAARHDAPERVAMADTPASAAESAASQDTLDLRRLGYVRGSPGARVVVYEFSGFGCPYCGKFARNTYPELEKEFVETGKVRWVFVPFVMGNFPNGDEAARAAECAGEQDRFWPMHDLIFARQSEWKASNAPEPLFRTFARQVGLDAARFASCYQEDRRGARTRANNRAADAMRVRATPTFLVNGRMVEGALPAEQFRALLQRLGA